MRDGETGLDDGHGRAARTGTGRPEAGRPGRGSQEARRPEAFPSRFFVGVQQQPHLVIVLNVILVFKVTFLKYDIFKLYILNTIAVFLKLLFIKFINATTLYLPLTFSSTHRFYNSLSNVNKSF